MPLHNQSPVRHERDPLLAFHTTDTHCTALAIHPTDPDTVYACLHGAGSGVYKTTDGGTNWTDVAGPASGLQQRCSRCAHYACCACRRVPVAPTTP